MDLFDRSLLQAIGKKLLQKGKTIAVAESVSSGLMQAAFSMMEDASDFFQGGYTVYNIGQKYKHLNVEPIHALSVNCVSQKVANEMAIAVSRSFCSDWGISITGYASPVPESGGKLFAYYAISHNGHIKAKGKIPGVKDKPFNVQVHYTSTVLKKLSRLIQR